MFWKTSNEKLLQPGFVFPQKLGSTFTVTGDLCEVHSRCRKSGSHLQRETKIVVFFPKFNQVLRVPKQKV